MIDSLIDALHVSKNKKYYFFNSGLPPLTIPEYTTVRTPTLLNFLKIPLFFGIR